MRDKLTDARVRAAKPAARPIKLFDGGGLALVVLPSGTKAWRLFYRVGGRQQSKSLGLYPEVSLAEARKRRMAARTAIAVGDGVTRPAGALLRAACATYWRGRQDTTPGYRANVLRALELHVWPTLGAREVASITRADVLECLLRVDAAGRHEYARKLRVWLGLVMEQCVERGQAAGNPCAQIRPERAFGRRVVEHHAALQLGEVGDLLRRLELEGPLQSVLACRLLALTWVRTSELRMMRWDELDGALWRLPAGRMKRRRDHLVPLPRQAVELLATLRARAQPGSPYVFAAEHRPDRPMSENAVLALLYRLGYKGRMSGHGWRSVGSTWAHEGGYAPDVIERQLAHAPDNEVRSAYNRAEYLEQRRAMLQAFADWLDVQASALTP